MAQKKRLGKKKLIQEQGVCPVCGDDSGLKYGDTKLEVASLGYEFTCKCGAYGIEWYNLTYAETLVKGKDKNKQLC